MRTSVGEDPGSTTAPVIVTGMHRSGTSLVAAYLEALGLDLGRELVPADDNNPRGYHEDLEFVGLSRRLLEVATVAGDGGHRDWGWTESERFDLAAAEAAEADVAARELVEKRRRNGVVWGWKDPRSTLLLDFWDGASGGDARFVLLYRYPWDVADSMQRLGAEVFLAHPGYAYRIWSFYNRRLLKFYREHRSRAVLASVNALVDEPERFLELLRDKLDVESSPASLDGLYDGDQLFLTTAGADPLIDLVAAVHPHAVDLLRELDQAADLSSSGRWQTGDGRPKITPPAGVGEIDLSIVIPCFDHGELLIEAVASVERSALESCELLIVDDGSRQRRTAEILGVLRQRGYRILDQPHGGLSAARNRGIEAARGRYIFPLDADNRVRPGFLERAVAVLDERREIGVVFGDRWRFGLVEGRLAVPEVDLERLLWRNTLDACAVYRKSLWADVGGYDVTLQAWEDWEFWIHAASREWRFHHLGDIAFDYRVRPGSLASLLDDRPILEATVGHIVSKHREIYRQRLHELFGVVEAWPDWLERQRDQEWLQKCALEEEVARHRQEGAELAAARQRLERQLSAATAERDRLWRQKCELETALVAANDLLDQRQREIAGLRSQLAGERARSGGLVGKILSRVKWGT